MTVRVTFDGARRPPRACAAAVWRYPRADGTRRRWRAGIVGRQPVTVVLTVGCGLPGRRRRPVARGEHPARARRCRPRSRFTQAKLQVTGRTAFVPQAAYYNDGAPRRDQGVPAVRGGRQARRRLLPALRRGVRQAARHRRPCRSRSCRRAARRSPSAVGGSGIPGYVAEQIAVSMSYLQDSWAARSPSRSRTRSTTSPAWSRPTATPHVRVAAPGRTATGRRSDVGAQLTGFTAATVSGAIGSEATVVGGERGHLRARLPRPRATSGGPTTRRRSPAFATGAVAGRHSRPCPRRRSRRSPPGSR